MSDLHFKPYNYVHSNDEDVIADLLDDFEYNGKTIPKTILGYGPFIAEPYYGHRFRLYQIDLADNPQAIADVIIEFNVGSKYGVFNIVKRPNDYPIICITHNVKPCTITFDKINSSIVFIVLRCNVFIKNESL